MVLFDEDPVTLISETTHQFRIAPDKDSLSRISDSLSSLSHARHARLEAQQSTLKALSRRLAGLQEGRRWEDERHDAGEHAARMLKMDTEKFRVAKGVSEVEIETERLGAELSGLRAQMAGLEREGKEGRGPGPLLGMDAEDAVVLKLHTYRSLGISATPDLSTGEFTRAIIRRGGEHRGDVSVVNVDGNMDQNFYTATFWDAL